MDDPRLAYAIILTHDRPEDFQDCVDAIRPQVDHLFVISHLAPYAEAVAAKVDGTVIAYTDEVPNISVLWNLGLRAAARRGNRPYDVAVLNDDAIVPPGWFRAVTAEMRRTGAVAGSAARPNDPRMAGFAFILDGTAGIFADEQFQWWFGDDDIEHRARLAGGVAQPGGLHVEHRHPSATTVGVLAQVAAADRDRFDRKWT